MDINVDNLISQMADQLSARLEGRPEPLMIGIHTGGVWVASQLHELLQLSEPLGILNIAFYRDDFSRIGKHPNVEPSNLPFDVDNRDVILVDDVLYTGRTIRAAMNEIFDYGRPSSISLAALLDRSGRELPIQADVVGRQLSLSEEEHVKLCGPSPLTLQISKPG